MNMRRLLTCVVFVLLALYPAFAQASVWQVFLLRGIEANGDDRLIFVNLITAEETTVSVRGTNYTVLPTGVLFQDAQSQQVVVASPDGNVNPHPLIAMGEFARRVDWAVSTDGRALAWTITGGTPDALTTSTWVAEGETNRQVLVDGPHDGIRAFPISFNAGHDILYMDYQPDTIADFTPFRQYASLFSLDLQSGATRSLPGEAGCFCGGGIGSSRFLRLTLGGNGFDLRVVNLDTGTQEIIPGIGLSDYTQGGDVLIAPDGTRATYALAHISNFGTPEQTFQVVFVLVDLVNMTQTQLFEISDLFLRPVAWTEDGSAILLTSPLEDGTWKISVGQNALERIASATYIGTMLPAQNE
jgi:hypothetical protein